MSRVIIHKSDKILPKTASKMFREAVKQATPELVIDELLHELDQFEQKFGMSTVAFYRWYRGGKMGDSGEIMSWAALFESYMSIIQHLEPGRVHQ